MNSWTRRQFVRSTSALGAGILASPSLAFHRPQDPIGLQPSLKHPETSNRLAAKDPSRFKILQLTDIHFFCGRDKHGEERDLRTIKDLPRLVDATEPHLLAVTGDLWHDNPGGNGLEFMEYSVEKIEKLGVPWLFTWGNHDMLDDYVAGHDRLAEAMHSLYRGGPGSGNYSIAIEDAQGKPVWELLCLNTTNIGIQKEQEDWIQSFGSERLGSDRDGLPITVFLHIPVLQYQYVWEEKLATGFKLESVSHYGEDGSGIWHLMNLGKVTSLFCGHDHVNDYGGPIEGTELVFGRATGHAGYGGEKVAKGGKLITLNCENRSYAWETVLFNGTRWRPEAGMQIEEVLDTPWMRGD